VLGAVVIDRGYSRDVLARKQVPVQLLVDGADPTVANQVLAKADALVRAESQRLAGIDLARQTRPVQVNVWTRYNPESRSALFMVPGLAAYLIAITAVLLTALTIAGEWERGSMEQLFASPIGRLEIILGKLLPYLVLGLLEFLLVVAFGMTAFDLPLRGSGVVLTLLGFTFLVGMLGQGLLVSVLAKNQTVATQAGVMSSLLPSLLLSGMIFPIENMPLPLQALSRIVPARYLVHGLRGVLLKGNGFAVLWPDLLAQVLFAVAIIALATRRFQRRLA
jgi:ABC-2 type transport system permease protein